MPNIRLTGAAVKPVKRHKLSNTHTLQFYISIYIKIQSVCRFVCLSVCSCLNAGLTAERINLIFGMHTHIWSDCAIGYMILTFEVIKGHFRSNKFLCMVPWQYLHLVFKVYNSYENEMKMKKVEKLV